MSENADKAETVEFEAMPGADIDQEPAEEGFDLNFGLGEEPADETEPAEELEAEAVEEQEAPVAEEAEDVEEAEEEPEPEVDDEEPLPLAA